MKAIVFFALVATASATPMFNVTDLGTLGGSTAAAFGLSSNGQAVGAATTIFGDLHAMDFSSHTDLTLGSSAPDGIAWGINSSGAISGTQYIDGQPYATIWNGGSAQTVAGAGSYAMGIDESGDVAGMMSAGNGGHAFVIEQGSLVDLGTLPGGTWAAAYAIDNGGQAAGYGNSGGAMRAFVWSPVSGYTMLGGLGGASSYASAIDDSSEVAGTAQTSQGYLHAVAWNAGTMQDLGTLGGTNSFAYGLNDGGQIVGYSFLAGGGDTHAFLFDGGKMLDLNDLIAPSSGWDLTGAYAINARGQIAGAGFYNGVQHAFLLTPVPLAPSAALAAAPEPPAWSLVLMGLACLSGWRGRWETRGPTRLRVPLPPRPPAPLPRLRGSSPWPAPPAHSGF